MLIYEHCTEYRHISKVCLAYKTLRHLVVLEQNPAFNFEMDTNYISEYFLIKKSFNKIVSSSYAFIIDVNIVGNVEI